MSLFYILTTLILPLAKPYILWKKTSSKNWKGQNTTDWFEREYSDHVELITKQLSVVGNQASNNSKKKKKKKKWTKVCLAHSAMDDVV